MLEPTDNPNPSWLVDPPGWLRMVLSRRILGPQADASRLRSRREKLEARRLSSGESHTIEYFHQLDDPYSHLAAQVLARFVDNYDVELRTAPDPGYGRKKPARARETSRLGASRCRADRTPSRPLLPRTGWHRARAGASVAGRPRTPCRR